MAQKAAKTLAARNVSVLNRTLLLTIGFHGIFLILRLLFLQRSLMLYSLLSAPAVIIQFWFERIGRPTYGPNGELKRSGEDLEAKGLTEWMWDVLYWTYLCFIFVILIGDYGWWAYIVVPLYSIWLAWTTFNGARQGLAGFSGADGNDQAQSQTGSKRQQKMEKRGQKVQYR
ncbi:DUF788 domain protein [Viridothelium virens]|uniref:DUF788 domain protein n=1 Tax=Viridothelium virens TaxID=1048519 RepID=A0A6A6GUS8_VIRVR|nr:DUF788 domain protein [Viridothelium virens]